MAAQICALGLILFSTNTHFSQRLVSLGCLLLVVVDLYAVYANKMRFSITNGVFISKVVVLLAWGGSATNGSTLSSFNKLKNIYNIAVCRYTSLGFSTIIYIIIAIVGFFLNKKFQNCWCICKTIGCFALNRPLVQFSL